MTAAPRAPQDRKPAARKAAAPRVRPSTPAEIGATPDQADGPIADVEIEENDGDVVFEWGGYTWHLTHQDEWRQSTNALMQTGQTAAWAAIVMPPEDRDAWIDLDPTNAELLDFMHAFGRAMGSRPGEPTRSGPSSRAMRRR